MAKTRLTPEVQEKIVAHIKTGQYAQVAAKLAGISDRAFWRWMQRGEDQVDEQGRIVAKAPRLYRRFRQAVQAARNEAQASAVLTVKLAAQNGDWKAAAWWLERAHPEMWGHKLLAKHQHQHEHTGKDGQPITVAVTQHFDTSKYTHEELLQLESLLARQSEPKAIGSGQTESAGGSVGTGLPDV